ncbi:tripartite tricarboxylate transporter substrate binding protein [Pigmentiphaga soli]|uniref:Tripartite tricarboxylate transporter substrate binding protein n=1 Tax=Pigmentiphaga soli TaxID=1007095 RepID=A0ABP8H4W5_9BURK
MIRKTVGAALVAGLAAATTGGAAVAADSYPSKPIRIVVVYPPGGGIDIIAREMGKKLTDVWGVPVVVENRPGAGTTLGANAVAKSAPDGYTLLMTDISFAIAPSLYKSLPYDTVRDFAPISLVNLVTDIMVAHPDVPANNVKELIALAKARPDGLVYASAGNGTLNHLAPEMFKSMAGINMVHVPYKGALAALNDVMAGRGQIYVGALISTVPQIKAGKIKAIAVTGAHRSPVLPDVPTIAESGVPGYDVAAWYGLLAPAGTPQAIVDKINKEVVRIVKEPEFAKRLADDGNEVVGSSPKEFATFLDSEIAKWRKAVVSAGATVD